MKLQQCLISSITITNNFLYFYYLSAFLKILTFFKDLRGGGGSPLHTSIYTHSLFLVIAESKNTEECILD